MKKRLLSGLLLLAMLLSLLPVTALAEDGAEQAPACICKTACTQEARNSDCPVCGADGAQLHDCALYEDAQEPEAEEEEPLKDEPQEEEEPAEEEEKEEEEPSEKEPSEEEEEPSDEEEEPSEEEKASSEEEGEPSEKEEPEAAPDNGIFLLAAGGHTHCICGGSVTAGNHTSHSDVTYTAWNGISDITYTNNTAYVYLTGNATLSSDLIVDGKTLYLCLNGKTLSSNGEKKLKVRKGAHLVLCDCQGGGMIKGATQNVWGGACVYLYTSTFDMYGGKLTGGKVTGKGGGGAIALDDQKCNFNMYGGEISGNNGNNYGGAIFRKYDVNMPNTTGGAFNMYGGTIKNNTAKNGGAFFSTTGGTINMTGGTISGNKATQSSNNAGGGAIYMRGSGTINISGSAQITGNSSSLDGGAILMGWGEINISDSAKINNNTANRWGGAICLRQDSDQSTTLNMRGGEISGNTANSEGGAVHVLDKDCQFYLYDGKITGNTSGDGGAIYLNQEPSWLIMQGGEISGNTATGNGGGVYIYRTGSVCQLYSGKIENNKASGNGGGIYINPSNSGQLKVGNKPLVQNNTVSGKANNVYLPSGKTLTIKIGMSKGASIGVTTANTSYPVAFSNNYSNDYANYFFADDANAHVEYKDDQKLYLVSGAVVRPLTVTFDPNGGTLAEVDKTKSLTTGETYGTLPVPSYAGYDFNGWYTEQNGGTEIKENTTVTVFGTQTLYAHWTPIHVHAYTQQDQKPEALKTPADCTNNAVYYLSCACGEVSTNDADTFTAANTALDHDWGEWTQNSDKKTHTRICKRDTSHTGTENCHGGTATCTKKAVCERCQQEYGELAAHEWQDATCAAPKTCKNCTTTTGEKNQANHVGGTELRNQKDATCTEDGYTGDTYCKSCDAKLTTGTVIDKLGHTGGTATCTKKAVCERCRQEYGEFAAHEWQDATCIEPKTCKNCAATTGEKDPTKHVGGTELRNQKDATCTEDGYTGDTYCKGCDAKLTTGTVIDKLGHTGGTATCTKKAVCERCRQEYGEMAAHSFTTEKAETQYLKSAATCTEKAIYYKSCAVCGLSSKGTTDEATFTSGNILGHDWGKWTANGNGTHTRVCSRDASHTETDNCSGGTASCTMKAVCEVCKAEYGEKDPEHHAEGCELTWTITDQTHKRAYSKCGKVVVSEEDHEFGDWTVTKKPTSSKKGEKERTCADCGYVQTKSIPARGSSGSSASYCTLTFESNGGSEIESVHAARHTRIDLTSAKYEPIRRGYIFTGWYEDKALTKKLTSIELMGSRTVYAGWQQDTMHFDDVRRGDWFYDDAAYVYANGLMSGTSAYRFSPDLSTTRAMIVTILWRLEGEPVVNFAMRFADVSPDKWYGEAIRWAAASGIVNGYSETAFGPNDNITREQLAAMLYRYAQYKKADVSVGEDTNILSFDDAFDVSGYAVSAMQWACGAGVMQGANGKLLPTAEATRAQTAAMLHRFCEDVLK